MFIHTHTCIHTYTHTHTTCTYARTQARLEPQRCSDCVRRPTWHHESSGLLLPKWLCLLRSTRSVIRERTGKRKTTTTISSHHTITSPRLSGNLLGNRGNWHSILRPENLNLTESQSSLGIPRPRAFKSSLLLLVLADEFIGNFLEKVDYPISSLPLGKCPHPLHQNPSNSTRVFMFYRVGVVKWAVLIKTNIKKQVLFSIQQWRFKSFIHWPQVEPSDPISCPNLKNKWQNRVRPKLRTDWRSSAKPRAWNQGSNSLAAGVLTTSNWK